MSQSKLKTGMTRRREQDHHNKNNYEPPKKKNIAKNSRFRMEV